MTQDQIDAALRRLQRESVAHDLFVTTLEQAVINASFSLSGMVHIVTGPPGCVMTLGRAVGNRLRAQSHPFNPHSAIVITARPPLRKDFQWNAFFKEGLEALDQPILGQTRRATESSRGVTDFQGSATFRSAEDCRKDFRLALQGRMTRTLVVLNAHHMLVGLDEEDEEEMRRPLSVFSDLAGEVNGCPTSVILSGEPGLLKMRHRSAETDLVSKRLTMRGYDDIQGEKEAKNFLGLLMAYEKMLENVMEPRALTSNAKAIRDRTHGTDTWIRRALWCAVVLLRPGNKQLKWTDIKEHLPTDAEAIVIGRHLEPNSSKPAAAKELKSMSNEGSGRRGTRRPGTRGPASDPVGLPP